MTIRVTELTEYEAGEPTGIGCLTTANGNLPLHKLAARAEITGLAARIELTQGFRNPYDAPLEATYVFPLPDRAAVTAMVMRAGDRTVVADLQERAKARDAYEAAIAAGQRASIAEEDRPGVFTMRVGNIAPGEQVEISLTFVGPLPFEDGEATLRIPLVVAPRYIPGRPLAGAPAGDGYGLDTDAVPDASRITPPVLLPGFPNPIDLSIEVVLDANGLPLAPVRSSLHNVIVDGNTVRLGPGERVNRDFILRLPYGDAVPTTTLVACADRDSSDGTFELTVLPPAQNGQWRGKDVVLVLDRSGSMGGWKMVAARRAAARIVDTLVGADRFAVLTFDNVIERPDELPDTLVSASDRNRFRAVEQLSRTEARGGTEMLEPLRAGLRLLAGDEAGRDRVLVLITDGQVGNEDQILRETASLIRDVRVHTVGIDQAVNAAFLARLASAGGGRCELVESEDRLDEAMAVIHRRIAAPLITGLSLSGAGVIADSISPARLPDVFAGAPLVIRGRYRTNAPALTLTGSTSDGGPWQVALSPRHVDSEVITKLWARAAVRDLEDAYVVAPSDELEHRIVRTSLNFGVLCRFTAFVAVDERVVNRNGELHRVVQPVEFPAGWDTHVFAPQAMPFGVGGRMYQHRAAVELSTPLAASGPAIRSVAKAGGRARSAQHRFGPAGDDALAAACAVAAIEARRLRHVPVSVSLRDLLDDLAARLEALAHQLEQEGFDAEALRSIIQKLRDPNVAARERANDAAEALAAFAKRDEARGAFWKRSPRPDR